ncbi:HAD family hydrolase [Amycolatopsis sp. SID8362]|uniref:HAD family hydrolase n=1 Tax=Amycolatopsis sp. SID8362 TaxID=2690346 RepID=UPI00136FB2E2|nr:HAD family hydrolase [Amycolatopsis sp. SID8362]NBH06259.1 HAD-IA family hydrolase [Amycolatopsis sp. SID8362]NED42958.1 HAD family hydrolase [Amycolatopsis sp. SID8362]
MPTRALVFDFDGTLADTESAVLQSWQEVFRAHGSELPLDAWYAVIGTQHTTPAMFALLAEHAPGIDPEALRPKSKARVFELLETLGPREGVETYLETAKEHGLKLAVASSSSGAWVNPHLERLGIAHYFDAVLTGDLHKAKPDPDLYLAALEALKTGANETIAFEDTPHGITAAKAAGLTCVAVPNAITESLDFGQADVVLPSFTAKPLEALLGD